MSQKIISVRASSFGTLFDCAYRFEGEQLLKMSRPSSLRAWMGTSIHASTAAFDAAALDGNPISSSEAADVLVEKLHNPDCEVNYEDDNINLREAEKIALVLHSRYCSEIAPKMVYQSIEMPLSPLDIDCGENLIIRLTGTMDRARVVKSVDGKVIADLKTGSRLITEDKVNTKGRDAQLGTYQILSEHTDGEETYGSQIIALQTTTATKVGISRVFDAKKVMLGDENQEGLLHMAAKIFKIGLFTPNPMSGLCDKKYCSRWYSCKFHGD